MNKKCVIIKTLRNNHFCCWDYSKHCCTKPEVSEGLLFWRLAGDWLADYSNLLSKGLLFWRLAGDWLAHYSKHCCTKPEISNSLLLVKVFILLLGLFKSLLYKARSYSLERVREYIRKRKTMRSVTLVIIFSKLVKRMVQINVHCCTISRLLVKAYISKAGFKNIWKFSFFNPLQDIFIMRF